jgi:cyclomaltodextrinase / maltogenic alpha-amylase / neopullulanase
MERDWVRHAIWWQLHPLSFVGAESDSAGVEPAHRLGRIVDWFDYVVEIGVSGIALGPVFASRTHGYDTTDHFRIDPRLGDDTDFRVLLAAAHDRGLRVLLDGVFNHVGRDFPAFVAAEAGGPEAAWFRREHDGGWARFEGHEMLMALNHDEPAVADHVVDVMGHWLAAGADGWRLDAAYAVPPRFWARVLPRVRERFPDSYVVGEVIHGEYAEIVEASGMDAVTQYELWKAIRSAVEERNLFELDHALGRHNDMLDTFVPLTFVGNHDVTRIASAIHDERHLPHALVTLFTVAGTPSVYYGDEQAFRGTKQERVGGDDAIRPQFPSSPADLSPLGESTYRLHQELIGLRRRHPWLHRARTTTLHLTNMALLYEVRADDHRLVTALNLDDTPLEHDVAGISGVLAGVARLDGSAVTVAPHGWAVLS